MPLLSDITDDAFLAGWSSSLTTLPDRFSNSLSTEDLLSLRYVEQSLNLALSSLQIRLGPYLEKAPVKAISELSSFTGKLQKSLCFKIHRSSAAEVFSLPPTTVILLVCAPVEAARLVAGWLKPNDFRLAEYLRLGCLLDIAVACFDSCECNSVIDNQGYHLLTCKHGGGPVWAHNNIVSGWADCVGDAGHS